MAAKKNALDALDALSSLDNLDGLDGLDALDMPSRKGRASKAKPGTLEAESAAELNEYQLAFKARAKAEEKRFELATDSEYWTCLCFQSREQADVFAAAMGGITPGEKYVDGVQVARALGIKLPPAAVPFNISSKKDRKLISLT